MKTCSKCMISKDTTDFSKNGPGLRSRCKLCDAMRMAEYDAKPENRSKATARGASYRADPIVGAEIAEYQAAYRAKPQNRNRLREQRAEPGMREAIKARRRTPENRIKNNKSSRDRRARDPNHRIAHNMRARFLSAFKGLVKSGSAIGELGCSVPEFRTYIESLWWPGMSWENYGKTGWELDHIVPMSLFDLIDSDQRIKASHYTNYQPLWRDDNQKKGDRIDWSYLESLHPFPSVQLIDTPEYASILKEHHVSFNL